MRTHNPLDGLPPTRYTPADRAAFLFRNRGPRAWPTGSHTYEADGSYIGEDACKARAGTVAHILRMDHEAVWDAKDRILRVTLTERRGIEPEPEQK